MSESSYSYTRDDRIKCEEKWEGERQARDHRVVECPNCRYRMMKQFWLKFKKPADCPGKRCEQLVSEYKDVPEDEVWTR